MNRIDKLRISEMRKLLRPLNKGTIVDIGGGLHQISQNMGFKETIVVDGDKSFNPDILTDLNKPLPLKDNSADVIVAGEIIEHLINPFRFLIEIRRILKTDGLLVLSTPNIVCLKSRIKVLFGKLPTNCATPFPTVDDHLFFHKSDFNWEKLRSLVEGAGLKIISRKNTGIFFGERLILPPKYCPLRFGEKFIITAKK